jgi:ubiquinone/menaquinone biosynthesis C-methylase UbiE
MGNVKIRLADKYNWYKYREAHKSFTKAIPFRNYLPDHLFNDVVSEYKKIPAAPSQDYSVEGMEALANERVGYMQKKLGKIPNSVLEIGPGAGFVLKKFKEQGAQKTSALDIVDMLYPEVKKSGVELIQCSANNMHLVPDKSYDLVVSWSALEHIPEPEKVFLECLRILKPGGYLYLQFGPLYYSPWGYHHYSVLKFPYLHLLFPERMIHEYAKQVRGNGYEGYLPWTNGLDIDAYKFLKQQLPFDFLLDSYSSGFDYYSAHIISKYPEIFKSKQVPFESFFIDSIQIGVHRKS